MSGLLSCPFLLDDGTGTLLVRPHDDTTHDLEPENWTTTYIDSSQRGPEPVQQFVEFQNKLEYPSSSSDKNNDRNYRQNLTRTDEEVYVFGTVQPRDSGHVPDDPENADRLVIEKILDDSVRELLFLISDDSEQEFISRRKWAL